MGPGAAVDSVQNLMPLYPCRAAAVTGHLEGWKGRRIRSLSLYDRMEDGKQEATSWAGEAGFTIWISSLTPREVDRGEVRIGWDCCW